MDFKGFSFLSQTDIFYGFAEVVIFAETDFFFLIKRPQTAPNVVILPDLIVRTPQQFSSIDLLKAIFSWKFRSKFAQPGQKNARERR